MTGGESVCDHDTCRCQVFVITSTNVTKIGVHSESIADLRKKNGKIETMRRSKLCKPSSFLFISSLFLVNVVADVIFAVPMGTYSSLIMMCYSGLFFRVYIAGSSATKTHYN